ncbi:MAG: class I SAM-dependent methyltransferase [Patescibacteria group bacterium]|nr:class I SAM-dependent methyltransferase [Patescibacteria group bacterium]
MIEKFYTTKKDGYFGVSRNELLPFFEGKRKKILEIGCGEGATLTTLKELGVASETVGIEINKESVEVARRNLDKILPGNIEEMDLPYSNYFDYIILADILEHLTDPWSLINKIKNYLKRDGRIVASIPNIRNYMLIKPLLIKGEWRYEDSGLLDKGHLRFFTREQIKEMFEAEGFTLEKIDYNKNPWRLKHKIFDFLTGHKFSDLFVTQFYLKAQLKRGSK